MTEWFIGIDLGGTLIRGIRTDGEGNKAARAQCHTLPEEGAEAVLKRMVDIINEVCAGVEMDSVAGIGVGAPGPIDHEGRIHNPPNLPGWPADLSITGALGKLFQPPSFIGNDANLAAMGEHRFGSGRGVDDLIYVTVSTGIGGGIISGGRLLVGGQGYAAEVGHQVLLPGGPICGCGKAGHLEALASGTAIAREARAALESGPTSLILEMAGTVENISAKTVGLAAMEGDPFALELVNRAAMYIGLGLVNLIHILEPSRILIGGGVSKMGDILLDPVRKTVNEQIMSPVYEGIEILPASLGEDVGLLGAVSLVLSELQ
jgi:glucokinase